MAVERDLVADFRFALVDPGIGDVREDFALEVFLNALLQRDALGVAQVGVGLGIAFGVAADFRSFIPLTQCGQDGFQLGGGQADIRRFRRLTQILQELVAIPENPTVRFCAEVREEFADLGLPRLAGGDFLQTDLFVLLVAGGQILERALLLKPGDAFGAGLEIQLQRALDGDLVKAEIIVVEHLADDEFLRHRRRVALHEGEGACLPVAEIAEEAGEIADVIGIARVLGPAGVRVADLAPLVAEALLHRHPEVAAIDELDLAFARNRPSGTGVFAVRENPEVGGDAGIVEELLGQGDDRLQPVVLDDPAADLRFARAGVAGEERRAIEDDADAAAAFAGRAHLGQHVLEKEERAVIHARQPGAEPAFVAELVGFVLDEFLLLLPGHAEGRIGQHVIEGVAVAFRVAVEGVAAEGIAEPDVLRVLALDQHVAFADGPGLVVPILPVEVRVGVFVELLDVVLRDREHAARAARRIVDRLHDVALAEILLGRKEQIHHESDDFARREMFSGLFVRLLRPDPDELLEDVAHLRVVHALGGEIDLRIDEGLDDLEEDVLLGHGGDLLAELEAVDDGLDVRREVVDVPVEVWRKLVGIVEEPRQIEPREIVELALRDRGELRADDRLGLRLDLFVLGEDRSLCRREDAVEPPQDGKRQDDLAVFVPFVGAAQEIADAPDEAGDLGVGFGRHEIVYLRPPGSKSADRHGLKYWHLRKCFNG